MGFTGVVCNRAQTSRKKQQKDEAKGFGFHGLFRVKLSSLGRSFYDGVMLVSRSVLREEVKTKW